MKYLDKINRVKRKTIVGVYSNLQSIENIKDRLIAEAPKYKVVFSITSRYDPFLVKIA
jgi:hypothetical protein